MSFATSSTLRARAPGRSGGSGLSRASSAAGAGSSGEPAPSAGAAPSLRRSTSADLSYANLESDEDFERLLASYDVPLVVDVLRRYLAMEVQSSLAGTAASKQNSAQIKRKFYERFNQILDRLFGNDEVSKHKYGGWMDCSVGVASASASAAALRKKRLSAAAQMGSVAPGAALSSAQEEELRMESYLDSLTPSGRTLTDLLGFVKEDEAGSVFQLLFKMTHPVEFKLELDLLPEQSKMSLLSRSAYTSVLFTQLLSKPITKQRVDPRNPVLLVSIKELFLFYFMRHPACANHQTSPATSDAASSSSSSSSSIMGSISDTFGRPPKRKENYSWRAFFTDGIGSLTKGNPYNVLLLQYLKLFFPDSTQPVKSRFHGKLLQYSNLFLHILIEFWLRQNLIVFADDATGATTSPPSADWTGYRAQQKLTSPLATVLTQTSYMAPSDDLLSSLLLTIIHLLSDPFYPAPLEPSSSSTSAASYSGMVVGSGGGYLSPSISVMRRPLYELLRLVFSRAPIGLSPTGFLAISDVWLAYIQPWNCQLWAKGHAPSAATGSAAGAGTQSPSDTTNGSSSPAAYSSAWETFVLANYHFYTTLLGAFIERAKELDFTGSDERSLIVLDRVLGVFTPQLLALLRNASDFLDKNQPYSINATSSLMQVSSRAAKGSKTGAGDTRGQGLTPLQGQVLTYHCKALGVECVGVPIHTTYHRDAERVFDKLWTDSGVSGAPQLSPRASSASATTPSWVGQPAETPFERVHRLSRQLRRVFEISDAYVASTTHSQSLTSANGLEPLEPSRHSKIRHLLTLEGVNQLRRGLRLCSPEELSYVGDPMLRPICSFEIGLLVRLSFRVSTWLNQQFGLQSPYRGKYFQDNAFVDPATSFTAFRFNLRFLASKPNLAFLGGLVCFLYLLLLW